MSAKLPRAEELMERARALAPMLFARAAEAETQRRCPEASIADYFAQGLDLMLKPRRFGGHEMGWNVLCETALALAEGCAAQGWVLTVYGDHTQALGMFSARAQEDVWGADPRAVISTSFGSQGDAKRVKGGAVLTGKWSFSSGIDHASWIMAGSNLRDDTDGAPRGTIFLLPKRDVRVIDDWHVIGLAGTGSKSFEVAEVFVPEHRMIDAVAAAEGIPHADCGNDAPVYRTPRRATAGFALASVGVGAAQGMLQCFTRAQQGRVSRGISMAEQQWMQIEISHAAASLAAARLLLLEGARATMRVLAGGKTADLERRALDKRDAGFAALVARQTADRLYGVAGGMSLHTSDPLQRYFRDIHAATAHHGLRWENSAQPFASLALGLAPPAGYY